MFPENVMMGLSEKTPSRICMIVVDGLGGIPVNGKTELEAAVRPNLDAFAKESVCGRNVPVALGITPGSGPGHLALFGYNPMTYQIGRGVLEALGIGLEMTEFDMAARANFATLKEGLIVDRRAGRIPTEENERLVKKLSEKITEIDDVKVKIFPGKEHRFVVMFTGENLCGDLADADPQKEGLPPLECKNISEASSRAARIVNAFITRLNEALEGEAVANTALMRGFACLPDIPKMSELYKLKCGAFATYPMYKGLSSLVGMDIVDCGTTPESQLEALKNKGSVFDFIYYHYKYTDSRGEDGDFEGKVKAIEAFDKLLPEIISQNFDVVCITADHSTPAKMSAHSWHPCPIAIKSKYEIADDISVFSERAFENGSIGRIWSADIMPILMANALKLKKFGA